MLKFRSIILFFSILFFFNSAEGYSKNKLLLSNKTLHRNDTLRLTYQDSNKDFKSDTIFAYIYSFDSHKEIPSGYNALLVKTDTSDDTFKGVFVIPDNSIFALIKIGDRFFFDTNEGEFWDFIVVDDNSTVYRNAYYRAGLSYMGAFATNYRRTPDFYKAINYYQKENMYYPDNLQSIIAELSLNYELGNISEKDYHSQLEDILASTNLNYNNEDEVKVIIKSLRILGKSKDANKLENKYSYHYPNSQIAKDKAFEKLAKINDFNDFIDQSILFLKQYNDSQYSEKLYLAIIQSYLQVNKFKQLMDFLNNVDAPGQVYYQIAYNLLENKELKLSLSKQERLNYAKQLLTKALQHIDKQTYINVALTPVEKNKLKDLKSIESLFLLSKLYWKEKDNDSLKNIIKKMMLFDKKLFSREQLYYLSLYSYNTNIYKLSLILSKLYISLDTNNIKINNINKSSYNKLYNIDNYGNYHNKLISQFKISKLRLYKQKYLEKKIDFPVVKTLDGVTTSLDIFRGRTLIVYSFGYFCDQCWDLFADIEKLQKKYNDDAELIIFPVLMWNKDKKTFDEIDKFLQKNKLNTTVYYDYLNEVYKNLTITGVPTISIIGPNGFLNFRIEGIKPNMNLYDEIINCLEFLNKYE